MKKYGLIGYPLTHSFSKRFFTEKFEKEEINATYENFEIESISWFPEIIKNNPGLIGLNVTIPYKEKVIPFLDELDEAAEKVGAVNTVRINRSKDTIFLKGYNTDTFGFEASLKPLLKAHHTKALILGTGGASKAIKFVLNKLDISFISASIEELKKNEIRYEDIDQRMLEERLLIINATPLGTYPKTETFPPIPYEYISEKHLLFDLVYNPEETQFMKKGKEKGAAVKNGYEMLLQQALKSYEIWNRD
ncbi:shikimate dehydrogenase [Tangfeifania diversioriginum]|uniref:Shikimate dehydrogenase n=1 Tax=Tangfeifania diversioriginum TaxID=1168035 RepID=A0A1M6G761_9BACT|nr:shikimate dehydrogenase [Tangfeifania diversioriginum]SHJ05753.1 shikimate dehydrogenase [Tangfeifania diversioriginum]